MVSTFKDRMALIKEDRKKSVFIPTKDLHSIISMDDSGNDVTSPKPKDEWATYELIYKFSTTIFNQFNQWISI